MRVQLALSTKHAIPRVCGLERPAFQSKELLARKRCGIAGHPNFRQAAMQLHHKTFPLPLERLNLRQIWQEMFLLDY